MSSKLIKQGEILSREEVLAGLPPDCAVVAVTVGDKLRIYSEKPLSLSRSYEFDILKKNRSGASALHGQTRVVCLPDF